MVCPLSFTFPSGSSNYGSGSVAGALLTSIRLPNFPLNPPSFTFKNSTVSNPSAVNDVQPERLQTEILSNLLFLSFFLAVLNLRKDRKGFAAQRGLNIGPLGLGESIPYFPPHHHHIVCLHVSAGEEEVSTAFLMKNVDALLHSSSKAWQPNSCLSANPS